MRKPKVAVLEAIFRVQVAVAVLFMVGAGLMPVLLTQKADAAQITVRKVTLSTAITGASSNYTFSFTTATSAFHLDGIKLIACSTAIGSYEGGTCTAPSGFSFATGTYGSISGFTDTTAFTVDAAGANDCIATAHPEVLCLKRTSASNDTAGAKTLVINAVTNPNSTYLSGGNYSFYIGIVTYNNNTWSTASSGVKDTGTVAASVTNGLTISATVAEILQFCVGSTTDNPSGGTEDSTNDGSCSGVSNSGVNLGTLDPTAINKSPVSSNGGNSDNGIAILRTNAVNGSSVSYRAVQDGGSTTHKGALKIQGIDCATVPSSCITSAAAQTTFTAGTQDFGMTIRGVNCKAATAYYTCVFTSGSEHLVPQTNYVGNSGNQYGDGNGFKWREDGSTDTIASASSNNTVADEALILEFAATPSITTTFGTYSTQADFIAVPTY